LHTFIGDTDKAFINNSYHDAGFFIRKYKNSWEYFKRAPLKWIQNNYSEEKNISIIGIPKNVGQAKYIGELLLTLKTENSHLNNTAVVLGDETLLIPVLNSIPKNIDALNITMGFPLHSSPLASLFDLLLLLHKDSNSSFHYKNVIAVLSDQFIRPLFITEKC